MSNQELITLRLPWSEHLARTLFYMSEVVESYEDGLVYSGFGWRTVLLLATTYG